MWQCPFKSWVHIFSGSFDSVVDKRMKNNLYDIKSWVHIFSGSFGLVVDKKTRGLLFEDRGWVVWGELSKGRVVRIPSQPTEETLLFVSITDLALWYEVIACVWTELFQSARTISNRYIYQTGHMNITHTKWLIRQNNNNNKINNNSPVVLCLWKCIYKHLSVCLGLMLVFCDSG